MLETAQLQQIKSTVSKLDRPTTAIINYYSAGGTSSNGLLQVSQDCAKITTGGTWIPGELKQILNITGSGRLRLFFVSVINTICTIRIRIVVDGIVAFDATSSLISNNGYGIVAVGTSIFTNPAGGGSSVVPQDVVFRTSLTAEVATNNGGTDALACKYAYDLT